MIEMVDFSIEIDVVRIVAIYRTSYCEVCTNISKNNRLTREYITVRYQND